MCNLAGAATNGRSPSGFPCAECHPSTLAFFLGYTRHDLIKMHIISIISIGRDNDISCRAELMFESTRIHRKELVVLLAFLIRLEYRYHEEAEKRKRKIIRVIIIWRIRHSKNFSKEAIECYVILRIETNHRHMYISAQAGPKITSPSFLSTIHMYVISENVEQELLFSST